MSTHIQTPQELTDEELAVEVRRGNQEKFGVLMERYEPKLHRYGRKFLSNVDNIEDVVQEVFLKVYENIQSFNTSKKFSPWIYRIAHNTFVNALRDTKKIPLSIFNFDTLTSHPRSHGESILKDQEQKEMRRLLDKGLEYLSPMYREVIILYYLEELSYNEIADVLHVPIDTVGVRLKRAKKLLKENLNPKHHNYG